MRAAAEHLTPTTLELGGKSPCIIDKDINMQNAIPRICFGKFNNAGQTCIAPDYILCHKDRLKEFVDEMKSCIERFYGTDPRYLYFLLFSSE
jgi:aldehyde dehydrogenase (NAD+)